ncbi:heat shock 70kDa protein 1/2/6/8 [Nematocida sp. AWRm78]|nr:heat shock 70kDa protein 1/2/6/8 [Nematocida sp. AWRm78]
MSMFLRRVVAVTFTVVSVLGIVNCREAKYDEFTGNAPVHANQYEAPSTVVLGIDLGTTNSVISVFDKVKKTVETIQIDGKVSMPSFVKMDVKDEGMLSKNVMDEMDKIRKDYTNGSHYYYNGMWIKNSFKGLITPIVGWPAIERMKNEKNSVKNYIYRFKPLLARSTIDSKDSNVVKTTKDNVKYMINQKYDEKLKKSVLGISINDENDNEVAWITPRSLSTLILDELRLKFELQWYKSPSERTEEDKQQLMQKKTCVITVPAYFDFVQKEETRDAAVYSLLNVHPDGIINEPTSAAIAYAYTCSKAKRLSDMSEKSFLVFDFGGGTLDISYLNLDEGTDVLVVDGHVGDNFLGGENVNDLIYKEFQDQLKAKYNIQPENFPINTSLRMRYLVEEMKIELCNKQNILDEKVRKEHLRSNSMDEVKYDVHNEVVKRSLVIELDGGKQTECELELSANKMEQICTPVYDKIRKLLDNTVDPNSKGNEVEGLIQKLMTVRKKEDVEHVLYVGGSSRLFGIRRLLMSEFTRANHCFDLDPDTCVSVGAAYYAASLEGMIDEDQFVALVDAIPMNMGIKLDQDMFDVMAEAGAQVPNVFEKYFTTTSDAQKSVRIVVGQTHSTTKRFSNTKTVGTFDLNMPHNTLPRGKKRIKVTFDIGSAGDMIVKATEVGEDGTDLPNGQTISITKDKTRLSDKEIEELNKKYEKTKETEAKWLEKCEKTKELEETVLRFRDEAAMLPETHPKKKVLNDLYKESNYWIEMEVKNRNDISDDEMVQKIQEKLTDLASAYAALGEEQEPVGKPEPEKAQAPEEAEEFIPKEDL